LYATIVPLLVYAVVGPSRLLVLGPDSALAPIIGASILPLAAGDPERAIALAGLLAILMGAMLIAGGLFKLGFLTDLLSKPIRLGYLHGIALVVIVGQIPKVLGFSIQAESLPGEIREIVLGVLNGETNRVALLMGIASLIVIVVPKLFAPKVPGVLIAVVGSVILTAWLGLNQKLAVVGALPTGLPAPALGGLQFGDVTSLIIPAAGIALIAFADTGVLSRTFAARRGDSVDGNSEMAAIGISNVASGLFGGFSISASASRTPVAEDSGAKTQLVGVVGAALVLLFMFAAPGLTAYLPSATLAVVVIVAATALIDLRAVRSLFRMSRRETALSAVTFLSVALLGVLQGILIAIGLSLLAFVSQAWRPHRTELVRVTGVKGYHSIERHPEGERIPGLVIARFDAPLFFANGAIFDSYVRSLVDATQGKVRWVVIASEPITGVDTTALDELIELDDHLEKHGVSLRFAEMKGPVKDQLIRFGLGERFPPDHFFPTLGTAVDAYLLETGVQFQDWDDPEPPDQTRD
ncbi:MAG: STAS domain-containing protein, partial [Actinobacteria bacterium]|nr:STAS domain-containing protein [Actinomycetota bacterium]